MVYKQIADDLRLRISSGELAPGDVVPTEGQLAEQWQTSRGPIRNALAELRTEGLIETARGRPARVASRKAGQAVDVSIPFTRWASDLGAAPGAQTQELTLRRASASIAAELEIAEGELVVDVVRLRLLDGRPTMLERLTYIESVGRLLFDADLDAVSITDLLAAHGVVTADVDHEIDAVAADDLDAALLGLPPGAPLLRLHRVARDAAGRTFETSDDRYRSDIVRFTVAAPGPRLR
ncbi:GntR family transcriptional regulator [Microbacterium sp. ASV49]|uniref:GntR family transcriptional regulator n=1 Tax=Microbacterium candidum TaxID=3041922 RepID=A0ABT7MY30_9MICO|nr:GntR family transcriptional regulator [Microbacterium sp. ASV49]MDL9979356.1 GntR family transcriptional regulator [Microbacterium sp. ASV49]